MVRMLQVPTIYFEASWPTPGALVDIMAIDRAGVGDVHVIDVKRTFDAAVKASPRLLRIPAQYRWMAFYDAEYPQSGEKLQRKAERAPLFPSDEMGRIGLIVVYESEDQFGIQFDAEVLIRGERFPGSNYDEASQFVASHKPDIMFR